MINDTTPRTILKGDVLGLDTVFNGLVDTGDLSFGDGTYRVYAAFCDPYGNVLACDLEASDYLDAWYKFEVDV